MAALRQVLLSVAESQLEVACSRRVREGLKKYKKVNRIFQFEGLVIVFFY